LEFVRAAIEGSPPFFIESKVTLALAMIVTLGFPLWSQSFAAQLIASQEIPGALPFAIPSLRLSGAVRPASGNRLHVVTLALGEMPIDADVRRFVLVTTSGNDEPIGAGGGADLIVPLDRIPMDGEVGEILPSGAEIVLTRSSTSVTLQASERATVTFLYELPLAASVRALRLPDGRELVITP
jgi:hypothetical protein